MARVRNWWSHSKTVSLIWLISAITFYCLFHMALQNVSRNSLSSPSDSPISNSARRARLYDEMSRDLDDHGALFLKHGETSQSLSLSDIFTLKDGSVTPVLKAVDPPVRANVLHLSIEESVPISEAVRGVFLPYFDKVIWFQNASMYHFSMYHASHHIVPVPATEMEVEAEATAVKAVAEALCPLTIVLDRVVLTSTGVVLGCWQVLSGADPITIRAKLRTALPHAPEKQLDHRSGRGWGGGQGACWKACLLLNGMGVTLLTETIYDAAMLHTSFARLLGHPNTLPVEVDKTSELKFFHELVTRLNNQIRGTQATVTELWYVEEYDVLALALNGRMKVRKFQLGCSKA